MIFASVMKDACKEVFVDPERHAVYIGDDHSKPDTGIVEYVDEDPRSPASDFFARWKETGTMLFECTVMSTGNPASRPTPCFALRGLWDRGRWTSLDIYPSGQMTIVDTEPT